MAKDVRPEVVVTGVVRETMIQRARTLRLEIDALFRDAARWNDAHPGEAPIDPDPDGRLRRIAAALDDTLAIEQRRHLRVVDRPDPTECEP